MYATLAEESFAPIINRTSKHMAASIDPIHQRQEQEQQRRRDRIAQLSADVEEDRRREETFAPRTSALPAGMSLEHRVPLADRSHRPREESPEPITSDAVPQLNAKSEAMVTSGARQHAEEGQKLRKQVQDLWAANSDGAGSMDRRGAIQCLRSMGVQSNSTTQKFLLALGFVSGDDIPRSEHVLHVEYDRFQKVFGAVLKAAWAEAARKKASDTENDAKAAAAAASQSSRSHSASSRPTSLTRNTAGPSSAKQQSSSPPSYNDEYTPSAKRVIRRDSSEPAAGRSASSTRSASQSTTDSFVQNIRDRRQQHQSLTHHHRQSTVAPVSRDTSSMATSQKRQPVIVDHKRNSLGVHDANKVNNQAATVGAQQQKLFKRDPETPFTFTPTINRNVVAKERGPIHTRAAMSDETAAKLEQLRHQRDHVDDDHCTFKPKTTEWAPSQYRQPPPPQQQLQQQHDPRAQRGMKEKTITPRYRADRQHDDDSDGLSPAPRQHPPAQHSSSRTVSIGYEEDGEEDVTHSEDLHEGGAHQTINRDPRAKQSQQHRVAAAASTRDNARTLHRSNSHASTGAPSSLSTSIEGVSSIATTMLGVTPGFESAVLRMRRARAEQRPNFEESLRAPPRSGSRTGSSNASRRLAPDANIRPECLRHYDPSDLSPQQQYNESHSKSGNASLVKQSAAGRSGLFELSASPQRTTDVEPFHFRTSDRTVEREHTKPLLYVDVDLPHGRTGRIGVHRGDRAQELAVNFCATYSLDEATMYRLTDILQVKIDSVLQERTRSLWV